MLEAQPAASTGGGQDRQGLGIQVGCNVGAGSRKHRAGPGPRGQQRPSGSFPNPEDQGQGPEFDGYTLS